VLVHGGVLKSHASLLGDYGRETTKKETVTTLSLRRVVCIPLLFVIAPVTALARKHDGDPDSVLLSSGSALLKS
jgi:hypothetical protein